MRQKKWSGAQRPFLESMYMKVEHRWQESDGDGYASQKKSTSVRNDDDKDIGASAHKISGYSLHCVDLGLIPGISEGTDTTLRSLIFRGV